MTFLLPPLGSVTVVQLAQQRVWTISSTSPQRKAQLWWLRWWVYQIFTKGTIPIFRKLLFIASHVQSIWKAVWQAFFFLIYNLNIDFLYSLELTPLGVCRSERKTYVHGKSCAQVFISTFINNCPQWKQPRHSTMQMDEQPWYMHTMKPYPARKRNKLLICKILPWNVGESQMHSVSESRS